MSNSSLTIDPRIIPLVRSLKEQNIKPNDDSLIKKGSQDISSEKTSEDSTKHNKKIDSKKVVENEKNKNDEKEKPKRKKSINRFHNKTNTMIKKNINTKISIDGSAENKTKSGTSDNKRISVSTNKIKIISKEKNPSSSINPVNNFQLTSGHMKQKTINNKARTKYIQNLLNDMSIKKYKNSCIDLLKNDNIVKKLYEQCGFEKTNYSYEYFIQNNFFNKPLFMYKLEMLFLDESNFTKKNFKENFFKSEIIKYLNNYNSQDIYQKQILNLQDVFKEGFESIQNFDLFHD